MATVKKGLLTHAGEWWRHLRHMKRQFWKGERKAAARDVADRIDEAAALNAIEDEIGALIEREHGPEGSSYRYRGFDR